MTEESILNKENAERVFEDFSKVFGDKYDIQNSSHLGIGAYASVFKTKELARNIDVAVKVHINGITPENANRGWTISTVAKNTHIAGTYNIESFEDREGRNCQAVITQFVPGKTLSNVLDKFQELKEEEKSIMIEDFAFSLVPSLLEVLSFCHRLEYGHGDLHEGNVMTHISQIEVEFELNAILIDFDNASIETEVYQPDEKSKIEADELLVKRMLRNILNPWMHMPSVEILLEGYLSVEKLKITYNKLLSFIKISRLSVFTESSIFIFLRSLLGMDLERNDFQPLIDSLAFVAKERNKQHEFGHALEEFNKEFQLWEETEDLRTDMRFIHNFDLKRRIYVGIFEE